jgi:DNA-binding transcriptional LysR family regulator
MRGSEYAELRAFVAVAEQGSFARAAAQLGISPSALTQTIQSLEQRLGMRLLNRTTRSVAPSEAGERLLTRLQPALVDLDAAVADVRQMRGTPSGTLRINAPYIAAVQHIAPLLGRFYRRYPEISVDLLVDNKLVDIIASRCDAGIRLGERVEKDMVAVRISRDLAMKIVAAPAYLKERQAPRSPRDLRAHRCINLRLPSDGSVYKWELERRGEKLEVAVDGPLSTNESDVALRAALDGVGIANLWDHQVDEHIRAGRLVQLLKEWTPPFPGFYLYYPSRKQMAPALRAFVDFLKET